MATPNSRVPCDARLVNLVRALARQAAADAWRDATNPNLQEPKA